jgi:2-iminobutanoate/2-iminopropanoate deaminase
MKGTALFTAGLVAGILAGSVLVEGQSPARRYLRLPGRTDTLPFSNGVLTGDTLHLAGTIGLDPKTGAPPADIEAEIRLAFESWKGTLAQAQMTLDDVVSIQVYCPDLTLYEKFNAVYRTYFPRNFPARAFLGSGPLLRGGHFEIVGTAVRR